MVLRYKVLPTLDPRHVVKTEKDWDSLAFDSFSSNFRIHTISNQVHDPRGLGDTSLLLSVWPKDVPCYFLRSLWRPGSYTRLPGLEEPSRLWNNDQETNLGSPDDLVTMGGLCLCM